MGAFLFVDILDFIANEKSRVVFYFGSLLEWKDYAGEELLPLLFVIEGLGDGEHALEHTSHEASVAVFDCYEFSVVLVEVLLVDYFEV